MLKSDSVRGSSYVKFKKKLIILGFYVRQGPLEGSLQMQFLLSL